MILRLNNNTEYGLYMYKDAVFNDPQIYATKKNFPFSITLKKSVDWDKLR